MYVNVCSMFTIFPPFFFPLAYCGRHFFGVPDTVPSSVLVRPHEVAELPHIYVLPVVQIRQIDPEVETQKGLPVGCFR